MVTSSLLPWTDRSRVAWWGYVLALAVVVGFVVYSFVGTFVLGVFAYYAARPLYDRVSPMTDSDGVAAAATVLGFVLPIVLLFAYAGLHLATGLQSTLGSVPPPVQSLLQRFTGVQSLPQAQWETLSQLVSNPTQSVSFDRETVRTVLEQGAALAGALINGLLHLSLALAMAFYLLRDDDEISEWFHSNVAERGSATAEYAAAVDSDLQALYFGNLLFVAVMSVLGAAVYYGTNALAPQGLSVPIPLVLAVLTGISSLIPLVVSKVVYVPVTLYLLVSSLRAPGNHFVFVGGFLAVCVVFLDLLPQGVVQPYVTGRKLHPGLLLFAYILGPIVWGWYGFFLLPLVVVLVVEVVRIPFTELAHGRPLTPSVDAAESIGTSDPDASPNDGPASTNDGRSAGDSRGDPTAGDSRGDPTAEESGGDSPASGEGDATAGDDGDAPDGR